MTDQDEVWPELISIHLAAQQFLEAIGFTPNSDAIAQLAEAFVPALRIICERDHAPDGATWKRSGWKPQLNEVFKKTDRINYRDWQNTSPNAGAAIAEVPDIINYLGFYMRGRIDGIPAWSDKWGAPSA